MELKPTSAVGYFLSEIRMQQFLKKKKSECSDTFDDCSHVSYSFVRKDKQDIAVALLEERASQSQSSISPANGAATDGIRAARIREHLNSKKKSLAVPQLRQAQRRISGTASLVHSLRPSGSRNLIPLPTISTHPVPIPRCFPGFCDADRCKHRNTGATQAP